MSTAWAVTAVMVIVLVPFAALFGALTHANSAARTELHIATNHQVEALVTDDSTRRSVLAAPAENMDYYATIEWEARPGVQHDDQVRVSASTKKGDTVDIWVDNAGNRVAAPNSGLANAVLGVAAAVGFWGAGVVAALGTSATVSYTGRRAKLRQWERDWLDFAARRGRSRGGSL